MPQSSPQPWCERMHSGRVSPRLAQAPQRGPLPKRLAVTQRLGGSGILLRSHPQLRAAQRASLAPSAPCLTCLGIRACTDPTATAAAQSRQARERPPRPLEACSSCLRPQPASPQSLGVPTPHVPPALAQQLGHKAAAPARTQLPRHPVSNFPFPLLSTVKLPS